MQTRTLDDLVQVMMKNEEPLRNDTWQLTKIGTQNFSPSRSTAARRSLSYHFFIKLSTVRVIECITDKMLFGSHLLSRKFTFLRAQSQNESLGHCRNVGHERFGISNNQARQINCKVITIELMSHMSINREITQSQHNAQRAKIIHHCQCQEESDVQLSNVQCLVSTAEKIH